MKHLAMILLLCGTVAWADTPLSVAGPWLYHDRALWLDSDGTFRIEGSVAGGGPCYGSYRQSGLTVTFLDMTCRDSYSDSPDEHVTAEPWLICEVTDTCADVFYTRFLICNSEPRRIPSLAHPVPPATLRVFEGVQVVTIGQKCILNHQAPLRSRPLHTAEPIVLVHDDGMGGITRTSTVGGADETIDCVARSVAADTEKGGHWYYIRALERSLDFSVYEPGWVLLTSPPVLLGHSRL